MARQRDDWVYTMRDDWVYTTRMHSTDAALSKGSCNEVTSVYLWTRPDKIPTVTAAALFSRRAVTQPMKDKSQFRDLSGVNYADPAFSPDPLSNLNISSSKQSPTWTTSPGPDHPTLKKRRPRAKDDTPPQPPNSPALPEPVSTDISTASSIINSPSFKTSSSSSPRPHPAAPSASSSSSSSFEPHVHARIGMPQDAHHHTLFRQHSHHTSLHSKPEHKKRHGFLSKLFGPSSSQPSENTTSSSLSPPLPSKIRRHSSMRLVPHSPSLPHDRAQLVHQLRIANPSPEMSMLEDPPRPAMTRTAAEAVRVLPIVAASSPVDDQWMHQDLDKIDELDESSPFGGVMHNGGPYEAISRFVHLDLNPKPHVKPTRIQQNSDRGFMMPGDVYRNAQIMALQKGTLDLKPGQILPRKLTPRVEFSHHPYLQPDSPPQQGRHHDLHPRHTYPQPGVSICGGRPPLEQPGPMPITPSVLQANPSRTLPGSQSSSSMTDSPSDNQKRTLSPRPTVTQHDDQSSGFAIEENTPHPINGTTITEDNSEESGSNTNMPIKIVVNEPSIDERKADPPPYTFEPSNPLSNEERYMRTDGSCTQGAAASGPSDRGQVFNMPQPPFPETTHPPMRMPSTSSFSRSGTWHSQPVHIPPPQPHSGPSRREVHSLMPPPLQRRITPADPRLHRASTYTPNSSVAHIDRLALVSSLQRGESILRPSASSGPLDREPDARSVQHSILTTSNASRMTGSSQTREDYRRKPYLPKHLVMPTPLQPALQGQAAVEQVRFDPRASPVHTRDSSPSKRRSTLVTSPMPRAEDVPMAPPGGKLRKRMSLLGGKKEQASPVAAVSFLADIVTSDKNGLGAEKARKNVLYKRR